MNATTFDPMTSDVRAEMDAFHAARKASKPARKIDAPAHLYEDSPKVKAIKVAGLLKAREDLRDLMLGSGVTADRIEAMMTYNRQLAALGAIPA
jgi:hypothetical protein